jgi:hypothetical protein
LKYIGVGILTAAAAILAVELQAETQTSLTEIEELSTEILTSLTCEVVMQAESASRISNKSEPEDLRLSVIDSFAFVYVIGYNTGLVNAGNYDYERASYLMNDRCKDNPTERFSLEGQGNVLD